MTSHNLKKNDYLLLPKEGQRFYRTTESYVLFEVKEIYVHPYENIVTKPTRGTPVKFLPFNRNVLIPK